MSRHVAAVATLIGPVVRVKVDPRAGDLENAEALADAITAGRLERIITEHPAATGGVSETLALFGMEPEVHEPEPRESEGRRRTKRQLAVLMAGRHPLSLLPWAPPIRLHPDAPPPDDRKAPGPRCGTCRFIEPWGAHGFLKCLRGQNAAFATHSEATDLRHWWPGCEYWEAAS